MQPTNHPTKKIGQRMWIISWVMLLVLLAFWFMHREENLYNPNQNPEHTIHKGAKEVILHQNIQGQYLTSGFINGHKINFLIDTGASDVAVPADLASKLQLKQGSAHYATTANGIVTVYSTVINTLRVGNIIWHNVKASINPGMKNQEVLLGMSALNTIQFSQQDKTLILLQQ